MKSKFEAFASFHRIILVALLLIGFSISLPTIAAINCSGNLSPTETIICKDPWLIELDGRLNKAYGKAIKVALNKQAFIRDQQEWLQQTRDRCIDSNCINLAYLSRITSLETSYELNKDLHLAITQGINESDLSSQESQEVCDSLAKLAANGRIDKLAIHGHKQETLDSLNVEEGWVFTNEDKKKLNARKSLFLYGTGSAEVIYKLKLTKNGDPVRFASFYSWGAEASSWNVFNLSIILDPEDEDNGIDEVDGMDVDDIRWAYYGGGDKPLFYRGRYFLFTSSKLKSMISWVKPNGRIRPLCLWDNN
jgi:uncharacterized protein